MNPHSSLIERGKVKNEKEIGVEPVPRLIEEAESWVRSLWNEASPRWAGRTGQDMNYRSRVTHPFLVDSIRSHTPRGNLNILDLGCGDGVLLEDNRFLDVIGPGGNYLGVDISEPLLEKVRSQLPRGSVSFLTMNLTDPNLPQAVRAVRPDWDLIFSVFVVQEIPAVETFFRNLGALLAPRTRALLITVHPDFAEWLRREGHLRLYEDVMAESSKRNAFWRWAGAYPIVDEPFQPFYLPHFQRTIDDYRRIIESSGLYVEEMIELPAERDITALVSESISPFRPFPTNVYWPRIAEKPSSLALSIRKRGNA